MKTNTIIVVALAVAGAGVGIYFLSKYAKEKASWKNLEILNCTVSKADVIGGETITIFGTFRNNGTSKFSGTWNCEVHGYGGITKVISLEAKETKTVSQPFTIPTALPNGPYAISLYIGETPPSPNYKVHTFEMMLNKTG